MSEIVYSTTQVANLFGVVLETVRAWSREFADHLSPNANPPKNAHRTYTEEDLGVLALVAELKDQSLRFEDIHAALRNGQRGAIPTQTAQLSTGKNRGESELHLTVKQQELIIASLEGQLEEMKNELKRLRLIEREKMTLEVRYEIAEQNRQQLQELIAALQKEIQDLSKQIGREYGKGYVEGFERRNKPEQE